MKGFLMVCLGNICRSPLAEGILRHKFNKKGIPVEVDSAGTAAYHAGEPPDYRSQEIARKHGIDLGNQRARKFATVDFDRFDKIYAMDRSNYRDLLSMARNQSDKDKVEMILEVLYPGENRQVPDPYYGGNDGFRHVFRMLDEACEIIVSQYSGQPNASRHGT